MIKRKPGRPRKNPNSFVQEKKTELRSAMRKKKLQKQFQKNR